jgi:Ca-activated chloride channel family protein
MIENVGGSRGASKRARQNMILGNAKASQWHPSLNPPNGAVYGDVFFKGSGTNPFIDTEDDAFSTFGMDVDTASYSVTRRFLRDELLPLSEAIRVEEFVNAFDYNYTPPSHETFAIHLEGAPSKFGEGKRLQLLRIGIQGRVIPDTDRKNAILTFVIDVSGSMCLENRLGLVKRALTLLVGQLRPEDKVGIVVYGTNARVVLPHTSIVNREHILTAIRALATEGATNAMEGLRMGYKLASQNSEPNSINRVILCSDGVANVGQTGSDAILKEIRTYVKEGVTLTTVGFGMGNYNDILMERLANDGNGSYAYVDTLNEAKRIFVENLTGTLQVIAKDAKIQIEFNPETVSGFRLLGYENRRLAHEDFRNDTVDAGEVGAGHSVTALYEIKLHEDAEGKLATVFIRHENPDTGNVTEVNRSISTDALKGSFEETTPTFQLAASVAEFAEILRGSFWAQEGSLEIVRETLEGVLPHIDAKTREHSARNEELLSLVRKVHRLKEQQKEG